MREIRFRLPIQIVRRSVAEQIAQDLKDALTEIANKRAEFETQVQKAIHGAYAGIVCAVCGKNVFRGEGTWVHGNGGKAYCLNPCWKNLNEEKTDAHYEQR